MTDTFIQFKRELGPKAKLYIYEIAFPPAIRIFMAIFELLERRFWTQLKIQIEWKHHHCMYFTEVGKFDVSPIDKINLIEYTEKLEIYSHEMRTWMKENI